MKVDSLSVFFPCINEEGNIESTVSQAETVLKKLKLKYEIIVVDDGSTDKTGEIADKLAKENSHIRVIHHPKNLGYGEALKSGFYSAKYDVIVYTDGDRQFDFSEVTKFLEKIKDSDMVIGYRIKRQDSFLRKLFGRGWRLTLFTFFGLTLKDVDCGFKMVRKSVIEKIPHLESQRGAMINAELAIKAKKFDFRITQVGVNHYPRLSGKPTGANIQVIIKSYIDLVKLWWKLKDEKLLFASLIFVLFLAGFFRFYKISEYMTFLGDEGRDAIVIKKILTNYDLPLIGPPTSVGNIYLGPLYYYLMTLPMAIFYLNPVAAAGMNAFFGVATVLFIYYLGKNWFGRFAGLVAAYLYAISPVTVIYSRSSWNPNPTPFFSLLTIFGFYKAYESKNFKWLILTGIGAAAAIQMHYLALILLPIIVVVWIKALLSNLAENKYRAFWAGTILAVASFLFLMSPLVVFDIKHNFLNYRAITELFSNNDTAVSFNLLNTLSKIPAIFSNNLIGRYIAAENSFLQQLVALLVLMPLAGATYQVYKNRLINFGLWILNTWLLIGVLGLSFYKGSIYDHYLGFLNPAPFLLLGGVVFLISLAPKRIRWLGNGGVFIMLITLTIVNLQKSPLLKPPNNQLIRTQQVAKFVINEAKGEDFNFALLAARNYDSAYQYYLDIYGHKPQQVPFEITDQLFVVCEDAICQPINNAKYEIAGFGWAKVVSEQNIYGVKVFKLVHNPSGKP